MLYVGFLLLFVLPGTVYASLGNIEDAHKYAWSNTGGWVNFAPTYGGITVTNSAVTGYAWSANNGWINFSPNGGGVDNDSNGTLSGFAWDSSAGWVNFSGVTIDSAGEFHGQATGSNSFVINFDCSSCSVVTTWRPPTTSGGGGPVDTPPPDVPPTDPPTEPPPSDTPPPAPPPVASGDGNPPSAGTTNGGGGGSGGAFSEGLPGVITEIGSALVDYLRDRVGTAVARVGDVAAGPVALVGAATGVLPAIAAVIPNITQGSDILLSIIRLWDFLLVWLGFRKRKPWGTVYDSVTKQPLDPAYVVLKDASGKEASKSITDLNGRYGFLTTPGTYQIEANKTHYQFPSTRLTGRTSDELYQDLYFGESLTVPTAGDVIVRNIPMDPVGFDWNEFIKKEKKVLRYYSNRARVFAFLAHWLFRLGFVAAAYAVFKGATVFDVVVFGFYLIVAAFRYFGFGPRTYGSLTEKATGIPLSFALVKVRYAQMPDQILRASVADKIGRYYALVPNGQYVVDVLKKNDDASYTPVYTSPVLDVKKGIINANFAV